MAHVSDSDSSIQGDGEIHADPMVINSDPEEDQLDALVDHEPMEHDAEEDDDSDDDGSEEDLSEDPDPSDIEPAASPAAAASEPSVHPVPAVRDFPAWRRDHVDPIRDEAVPESSESVTSPFDPTVPMYYGRPPTPPRQVTPGHRVATYIDGLPARFLLPRNLNAPVVREDPHAESVCTVTPRELDADGVLLPLDDSDSSTEVTPVGHHVDEMMAPIEPTVSVPVAPVEPSVPRPEAHDESPRPMSAAPTEPSINP